MTTMNNTSDFDRWKKKTLLSKAFSESISTILISQQCSMIFEDCGTWAATSEGKT
jgi:hypothetical protein